MGDGIWVWMQKKKKSTKKANIVKSKREEMVVEEF